MRGVQLLLLVLLPLLLLVEHLEVGSDWDRIVRYLLEWQHVGVTNLLADRPGVENNVVWCQLPNIQGWLYPHMHMYMRIIVYLHIHYMQIKKMA